MNYRHAFHAGNFADVMKHAVLALIITHLKAKPKPFRIIDTHAGIGIYDLCGGEASRTGEWRDGIGRLVAAAEADQLGELAPLLAPFLDVVAGLQVCGSLQRYPGSPALAQALLRHDDRLIANELHAEDGAHLRHNLGRDKRVKVLSHDGWSVLKSALPPKERRGVILIDPPFEQPGEFDRMVKALGDGVRRFASGIYMLWYPLKNQRAIDRFKRDVTATGLSRLLTAELTVGTPGVGAEADKVLFGSGLLIHNPPYGLHQSLDMLLPALARVLARDDQGSSAINVIRGED